MPAYHALDEAIDRGAHLRIQRSPARRSSSIGLLASGPTGFHGEFADRRGHSGVMTPSIDVPQPPNPFSGQSWHVDAGAWERRHVGHMSHVWWWCCSWPGAAPHVSHPLWGSGHQRSSS
ncbi:MAG TPA: hypothetical protein VLB72_10015 [Burkholderiales bacterium]|nr:hypothetical protein [Burkholderiales bacterium]